MEFFNQKEEVLDVVLTKKGRELFSKGKFKPYGYKFFDNETVYEAENNEEQNKIVPRIKETPYIKQAIPSPVFNSNVPDKKIPSSIIAPYGFFNKADLVNELGQSDQFTEYAPSWNINFAESTASYENAYLSASFDGSSKLGEKIPQFNVTVGYKVALVYTYYDSEKDKYFYGQEYKDKFNFVQLILQKDTDDLFLKINENNSFIETQPQELTLEMYKYINSNGIGQLLKSINMNYLEEDSYSKYFTILFDDVAEESSKFNTKNIYGEPETEDVC